MVEEKADLTNNQIILIGWTNLSICKKMNWKKLKERFPNSEPQIREHLSKTKIQDSRTLINDFLESKGYIIGMVFIKALKDYEKKLNLFNSARNFNRNENNN